MVVLLARLIWRLVVNALETGNAPGPSKSALCPSSASRLLFGINHPPTTAVSLNGVTTTNSIRLISAALILSPGPVCIDQWSPEARTKTTNI
jgi:hypothetical protein